MATLKGLLRKLTLNQADLSGTGFSRAVEGALFPKTNPAIDGDDCLHDCENCTIKYPAKFSIDETEHLFGEVKGWSRHLIVATGKTDWVRDVADEKGSIMEAISESKIRPNNGRMMLSASNIPVPENPEVEASTKVLLLPSFVWIENVTPGNVPVLISHVVNTAPTNTTPLIHGEPPSLLDSSISTPFPSDLPLKISECPHNYLILLCSQKTRDARCGQSAPLLRREFERQLRPLGLYRDLHDDRPGGVGVYFISHVGGHKFSANCMIYRRVGATGVQTRSKEEKKLPPKENSEQDKRSSDDDNDDEKSSEAIREAAQCIWLARVRPEDCENIVRYTVLQGKVVKPERQLRGGFDRSKQLVSW